MTDTEEHILSEEVSIQRGAVRVQHQLIPSFINPVEELKPRSEPTISDTFGAAFRQENDVVNFIDYSMRKEFEPESGFKLKQWLVDNNFWENYRQNFYGVESEAEAINLGGRIRKEENDRGVLEDAGWAGLSAAITAGVLSPTMFIPLTAGGRGLAAIKQGAKFGLLAGAAQEIVLVANQELRTGTEVGIGIGAATILGGILGGAVGFLGKRAEQRLVRQLLDGDVYEVAGLAKPPRGSAIPEPTSVRLKEPVVKPRVGSIVSVTDDGFVKEDVFNEFVTSPEHSLKDNLIYSDENLSIRLLGVNLNRTPMAEIHEVRFEGAPRVIQLDVGKTKDELFINNIGLEGDRTSELDIAGIATSFNELGPRRIRNLLSAYTEKLAPDIEFVSGDRIGGARFEGGFGRSGIQARVKISKREAPSELDEATSTPEGLANLRLAEAGGGTVPQPVGAGIPTPKAEPELADAGRAQKVFDKIGKMSPVVRTINQSVSRQAKWMMAQLSNAGLAVRGGPVGGTIENRIKTYYANVAVAMRALDDGYADYVFEGAEGAFVRQRAVAVGFFNKGKLSKPEFNEEVGRSLFSGDASEIPQATQVAKLMREKVYDPLLKAAEDAGNFGEEVATLGDKSYFNRLYDKQRIKANKSLFIETIGSHYERKLNAEFLRRLDKFNESQKKLEQDIQDMKRSPEDVAAFRDELKEELEALDSGRTVELAELEEGIDELRAEARVAGKDPEAGRPILTEVDGVQTITTKPGKVDFLSQARELEAKGGEALSEVRAQRANIRRRLRALNRSTVTLGNKYVAKLEKIERAEELNIAALNRVGKSARSFLKNMDNLDDDELLDQLAKVRNQFSKVAEGFDKREARIFKEAEGEEPIFEKLAALDDIQKSSAAKLNELVRKIEDAEEVFASREVLRDLIQGIRDEALSKVSQTISRRALRTKRLSDAADKIAPERVKELIGGLDQKLARRVGEFSRRIEELGGEGVDLVEGVASFKDTAIGAAEETTEKILKTGQRLAGMDIIQDVRGPMLARVLDIPSEELARHNFIELNAETAMRVYVRTMAPDIELSLKFGSPNGKLEFDRLNTEMNQATRKLAARAKQDKWTKKFREKEEAKLVNNYSAYNRDLNAVIGRLRHTWGIPDDPDAMSYRLGRAALNLNTLRFMGSVMVSSIPDLGRPVMKFGLLRTLRDGFVPLISNLKEFKMSAKEIKLAGGALDVVLHTRSRQMFDLFDEYSRGTVVERGLEFATGKIGIVAGFDFWNSGLKQLSGVIANARMLDAVQDVAAGKASKETVDYLVANGINGDLSGKIWKELQNAGSAERVNGIWLPNTEQWTDGDTARAFRSALVGQVDDTIVTPGVERPLISDRNLIAKLAFQFKSFALSSTTKTVMAGLQQRDMAVLNGMAISLAFGALSYYIWARTVGKGAEQDMLNAGPAKWADEAITRSGLLGALAEVHRIAERIPALTPYVTFSGERTTRRQGSDITEALAGPTFDLANKVGSVLTGIDDPTQSTLHSLRLMAPYQNVFWLRQVIDKMEQSVNLPERRNQ